MQQTLADKLYLSTGVESSELDAATEFLGLEKDKEYQVMCNQYAAKMTKLNASYNKAEEEKQRQ